MSLPNNNPPPPTLPQFSLAGKTCIVTGGAGGLGKEFVVAFVLSGANCAIIDLPGTEHVAVLAEARAEAVAYFGSLDRVPTLRSYVCDVTTESQVQATVAQIVLDFDGKIDVLVTAAGVVENVCVEKYPLERFKRVLDVNLNGTFLIAREVGAYLIANKRPGSIIFVSSMSSKIVNRPQNQAAYNASKAAVSHLMRSMATEWAPYKIRVNALCPGYQATQLLQNVIETAGNLVAQWEKDTPMGRLGNPKELRGPVVFMASEASAFMTGHELVVDGGFTVL